MGVSSAPYGDIARALPSGYHVYVRCRVCPRDALFVDGCVID